MSDETRTERLARDEAYNHGIRDRRVQIGTQPLTPIDKEYIKFGYGLHWWNGYQAGARL